MQKGLLKNSATKNSQDFWTHFNASICDSLVTEAIIQPTILYTLTELWTSADLQRNVFFKIIKSKYPTLILHSSYHIYLVTQIVWCIKSWTRLYIYLYICRQLSVFPTNFDRICPIKLKTGMLYRMNNTVWNTLFLDICPCFFKTPFFF